MLLVKAFENVFILQVPEDDDDLVQSTVNFAFAEPFQAASKHVVDELSQAGSYSAVLVDEAFECLQITN
jgi:hypothetical protein